MRCLIALPFSFFFLCSFGISRGFSKLHNSLFSSFVLDIVYFISAFIIIMTSLTYLYIYTTLTTPVI